MNRRTAVKSLLAAAACGIVCSLDVPAADFGVLVRLGLTDTEATEWSGSVSIAGGEVTQVRGWRFRGKSKTTGDASWAAWSDDPGGPKGDKRRQVLPVGVLISGRGEPESRVTVKTPRGDFSFGLAQLAWGAGVKGLGGAVSVRRTAMATVLSDSGREDDYPALCIGADGSAWCVWQSYENQGERLFYSTQRLGEWAEPQPIPGVAGDIYKSACAWVGDRLWVVWAQFEDADWNLKASGFDGTRWSRPQFLTTEAGADVEPAMVARGDRGWLVWQAPRGSHSDIWLMTLQDGQWGKVQAVTQAPGNDWMPQVDAGPDGTVTVVWDTYRNGNYDVYLRQLTDGRFGPETPVAADATFEAYATVAVDASGRAWVAYEEGTEGWGKDQGAVAPRPMPGTRLYARRVTRVRVFDHGQLLLPASQPESVVPGGQPKRFHEKPRLSVAGDGRVYLCLRWAMATVRYLRGRGHYRHYKAWESYVCSYAGDSWTEPVFLPQSICRLDSYAIPSARDDGGLVVAWHTDSRTMADVRKPVLNRVAVATLPSPGAPPEPTLTPVEMPKPLPSRPDAKELADTDRIREFRTPVGGTEHRILRGDTHRHTEVSWDGSGDGSMVDVWRYGIDPGALDFLEITDHNQRTGPDLEYVWWRTQKLTDVYHNPPHFITLFGYERSLSFPYGHRNVINSKRGYRTFPITTNPSGPGVAPTDTKQLYESERDRGSVIISHTSGTRMGNDWRDSDPVLEPVVEIYQGARTSYEYEGAPKSATPGDGQARGSGYQPEGFVWRAWEKGLRLGIIASSDHGSTHISYASVYADAPTREGVVDALKKRHTFGATDNIILELRSGTSFMGDEVSQSTPPALTVRAIGTGELSELAIVKDLRFVYSGDPDGNETELTWQDREFEAGTHLYYVRVRQADGQIAWSSPLWITKR